MDKLDEIMNRELPELEKLALAFDWITSEVIGHTRGEIDLARAMHDQESVVKYQVKLDCFHTARSIFQQCHLRATGRRAWHDQDRL